MVGWQEYLFGMFLEYDGEIVSTESKGITKSNVYFAFLCFDEGKIELGIEIRIISEVIYRRWND